MRHLLRMTEPQYARLRRHVLPEDGREAAAVLLCGRGASGDARVLAVREVHEIPHASCRARERDLLAWPTDSLPPLLDRAQRERLGVVAVHGHPGGLRAFSRTDDAADRALLDAVHLWVGGGEPHGSMILLPGGDALGRVMTEDGSFHPVELVTVVGDDLRLLWHDAPASGTPDFLARQAQAFGEATTATLRRLRVAVVGVSGTGGPLVEQLLRLGVGALVLVDPDRVETCNLNRIPQATREDARLGRAKVEVVADAVRRAGLGTRVETYACNLKDPAAVRAVSTCDLVFGCMDGHEGRHLLNRLAAFYSLPYIDLGVRLDADGRGGVELIAGRVHWLRPGGSSLHSRRVVDLERVRAEGLRRQSPEIFDGLRRDGYIRGAEVSAPAVAAVNTLVASLAAMELLARIHGHRDGGNAGWACTTLLLSHMHLEGEPDGEPCPLLGRHVGRGDAAPLLDDPELTEREAAA
jgi:hypothetical protein